MPSCYSYHKLGEDISKAVVSEVGHFSLDRAYCGLKNLFQFLVVILKSMGGVRCA